MIRGILKRANDSRESVLPDLIDVDYVNRQVHRRRNPRQPVQQGFVGARCPNLGRPQRERVEINHCINLRSLFFAELPGIEFGSQQAFFFAGETDENKGVRAGLSIQAVEQGWSEKRKPRSSCPTTPSPASTLSVCAVTRMTCSLFCPAACKSNWEEDSSSPLAPVRFVEAQPDSKKKRLTMVSRSSFRVEKLLRRAAISSGFQDLELNLGRRGGSECGEGQELLQASSADEYVWKLAL